MIEENHVSFDTAKLLKEAGFDVPCRGVYVTDRTGYYEFREYDNKQTKDDLCWNTEDGFQYEYLAPTRALAARWLREKHGIHVCIDVDASGWYYDLCKSDNGTHILWSSYQGPNDGGEWDSYEEAIEEGLKRGLELIKK